MRTVSSMTCPIYLYRSAQRLTIHMTKSVIIKKIILKNYSNFVKRRNRAIIKLSSFQSPKPSQSKPHRSFYSKVFLDGVPLLENAVNRHSTQKHRNILSATKSRLFAQMLPHVN